MHKPPVIQLRDDPNDEWARVELYRWQYGGLPKPGDFRPMSAAEGMRGMAKAIEKGDRENFPSPMNVVSVLQYAAKLLDQKNRGKGK